MVAALLLSAGLLVFVSGAPAALLAQNSPLQQDSPLSAAPPVATDTPTMTPIPTEIPTETPTPTATLTATATATPTATSSPTSSPSPTPPPTAVIQRAATATPTATQSPPPAATVAAEGIERLDLAAFDSFVNSALRRYGVPGAAVAVIANDQAIFSQGYGVRQLGDRAAVDADTRFELGSVSHFLLANAAAALAEAGAVDLDQPVVEYLPEFTLQDTYAADNSNLRDLLAHRTGLPAFTGDLLDKMGFDRATALTQLQFLPPADTFRAREGFSNLGVFAAGEALAAVEGKPWEEVVAERVFTPLTMSRSSGYYDALLEDDNAAAAHFEQAGGVDVGAWADLTVLGASGQMVSTLADLTSLVRMLLAGGKLDEQQILAPETVQTLFAPAIIGGGGGPLQDPLGARCLGCTTYYYHGHRIVEANGAVPGARAMVLLAPDDNLGLIVLANRDLTVLPESIRGEFLEQLFGEAERNLQADVREQEALWRQQILPPQAPADPFEPTLALTDYAGTYENDFYGRWTIASVLGEDKLDVAAGSNGYPGVMLPHDGDTFLLTWQDVGAGNDLVTFSVENNIATGFTSTTYGSFTRVEP